MGPATETSRHNTPESTGAVSGSTPSVSGGSDASGPHRRSDAPSGEFGLVDSLPQPVKFGTFTGVFTPTLLTIFGVIMYVRVGWAVGNAGLLGTWLVMFLAMGITTATGLSLSSIATNTRIGAGGPYAIMARSLGLEVGGSIGAPLFLTRPLGVAMYVIGFREGWLWIFPEHPPMAVDLIVFAVLAAISYISAEFAFRLQYLIMAVIVGSLVSILLSPVTFEPRVTEIVWWGDFPGFIEDGFRGTNFWGVFAVFFPATTGILAGANMSGDLENPRRAIPVGTLWAIGISSVVYFLIAWWCARAATADELSTNYNIVIDLAFWPPIVLAGLLGATASSALAGLVGGPRILMAMGQHRVIPYADEMAETAADGNPRRAIVVTAVLTLGCIMVRDLNAIAPLVTMFFLITYGMLNVVVLLESSLGLVSFRPTLRIPRIVPFVGLAGCVFSMFIVSPIFSLISVVLVGVFYVWLQREGVGEKHDREDVRSSVFVAMAQWAASRVTEADQSNARAWKPNLLVPVVDPEVVRGEFEVLLDMTRPDGSVTLLGLRPDGRKTELLARLRTQSDAFCAAGVQSSAAVVDASSRVDGIQRSLEALQAAFFRPNVLVIPLDDEDGSSDNLAVQNYARVATEVGVGMLVIAVHPKAGFGRRKRVHLWVQRSPQSWDPVAAFSSGNLNLSLLTGFRLLREWEADVSLMTCVRTEAGRERADRFLEALCDLARLPAHVRRTVLVGAFEEQIAAAPVADVSVIGLPPDPDPESIRRMVELTHSTCIFVRDSGRESALV